jgi:hypothetical protein
LKLYGGRDLRQVQNLGAEIESAGVSCLSSLPGENEWKSSSIVKLPGDLVSFKIKFLLRHFLSLLHLLHLLIK